MMFSASSELQLVKSAEIENAAIRWFVEGVKKRATRLHCLVVDDVNSNRRIPK